MGWGIYHTSLFYSYKTADIKETIGLNYNQYSRMISITQRSMFWKREGFMTIDNSGKITTGLGNTYKTKHKISNKTIFDYHTHPFKGNTLKYGDGFSYGKNSDETTRMFTIQKGYKYNMYLGTKEGHIHFWSGNNIQGTYLYNFTELFSSFNLVWSLSFVKY